MFRLLKGLAWLAAIAALAGLGLLAAVYYQFSSELPDPGGLRHVEYQTPLEIYSADGELLARFGSKKRFPVAIEEIPESVVHAFLATEDARFYEHPGIDIQGLLRAAWELVRTGKKGQGGSTITMQVARNFFLSPEKTYTRKLKEILLALEIEQTLSKDEILELYLNKIYLGHHAYGVAAAAEIYYGKSLEELDLAQIAMIAGLPKAPSRLNPITNPQEGKARRNYVLKRMRDQDFISESAYRQAVAVPVSAALDPFEQKAPYVTEQIRAELYERYGEALYTQGYRVTTTIDSRLQQAAERAVQFALHAYDERHGYRGVEGQVAAGASEAEISRALARVESAGATLPGLVVAVNQKAKQAQIRLPSGQTVTLEWSGIRWARPALSGNRLGAFPKTVEDVFEPGDLIRLRRDTKDRWRLAQIPQIQGALISVDSRTGAIRAMVGGYDFDLSEFNRAVQSQRQPGSGFKPVLYTAALETGFTPASLINDAPIVVHTAEGAWRPENYSGKFYGPTRLRVALRKSRNLVSIRLLREIGLDKVIATALRFGFQPSQLPRTPTLALGSGTASPLDMSRVFSVFANGGYRIEPHLIEQVALGDDQIVSRLQPLRACESCEHPAPRILSPGTHYLMHTMLQDVVRRGTAVRAKQLGRQDLAGKTGTTDDQRDAWFNGYASPLVAISWVGFDSGKPLGYGETGSRAALPMWIEYMKAALENQPEHPFPVPDKVVTAWIDPYTGKRTESHADAIEEYFLEEQLPEYQPTMTQPDSNNSPESILNTLF
ncbi:penicillin-binding protein 1A [Methylohalobius crimeensis]|uniref:penicillin-binding protein 1A n=1 Tax=Methylohalobius crimeensis TaxID=244365 RepID=UPI0003B5716C|nr:penicillin-binding protein 1A [Methylohalobius crimeensis]